MVVSQNIESSKIGIEILNQGGNAIDAAVAVGFSLAITLPRAGNLGGGGFMMIYLKERDEIFAIDYADVQWAETGEWLTEDTFGFYRETRPDGQTMHHYIREDWNRRAIQRPHVMVASDAMPLTSYERKVVPNAAGTSTRILGQYV